MTNNFGFIRDSKDIKVLILFILRRVPEPLQENALTDATLRCDSGINYFEYTQCLAELVNTEHILRSGGNYSITAKGIENGEIMESDLPYTVRMKAERIAAALSKAQRRDALISAEHDFNLHDGYTLKLGMSDSLGKLLDLSIYCADESQMKTMERNFRKNAEIIYTKITDILLDEGNDTEGR